MEVKQILPFVRYAHYTELLPEFTSHPQTAYDQRIFFCARGKVSISVAKKDYTLSESHLIYIYRRERNTTCTTQTVRICLRE